MARTNVEDTISEQDAALYGTLLMSVAAGDLLG